MRRTIDKNKHGSRCWSVVCDCGAETVVDGRSLRNGDSASCGCVQLERVTTHGHTARRTATPEYRAWVSMKTRCGNPHSKNYPHYGGRGITVCPEWRNSFECFLKDVGLRPSANLSLDRRDNDGNYQPDNVRWATRQQQATNRQRLSRTNTSGFRGVVWCKCQKLNPWMASIRENGRKKHLGYFADKVDAALAYDAAARALWGEFANCCNFPLKKPVESVTIAAPSVRAGKRTL